MFSKRLATFLLSTGAIVMAVASSPAVQAQPAGGVIEEIFVTARMRSENLQEVPAAVDAFTAEEIEQIGVSGMRDYAKLVPNFFLVETQNSSFAFVNIRGITQMRNLDPSVAIVVDGVLSTNPISMSQELFDIEQIEVLKGPQGALYGRSAVAGAINITTKRPANEFEAFVRVGVGDGDASKVQGAISGALVEDRVFGRLSASFSDADGWRDNVTAGQKSDPAENQSIRGRVIFQPSDIFEADIRFSVSEDTFSALQFADTAPMWAPFPADPTQNALCGMGIAAGAPANPVCVAGPVTIGTLNFVSNPTNPATGFFQGDVNDQDVPIQDNLIGIDERDLMSLSALLRWEFDSGTLQWVSSFDDAEDAARGGQPPRTAIAAFTNSQWRDTETFSQEIRFTSPSDQRLRWIAGAYWLETEAFLSTTIQRDTRGIDTLENFVRNNPEPLRCNFAAGFPFPGSAADSPTDCVIGFDGDDQDNTAYAVFAQINYDITDTVEFSFSGRFDKDEREQTITTPNVFLPFIDPNIFSGLVRKEEFDSFQPKVTLRWTPQDNLMLYGLYAEGFRSGGFNRGGVQARADFLKNVVGLPPAVVPDGVFDLYPQQDTESIEFGLKFNTQDGRWVINSSLFSTTVDNYQTFTFNVPLNSSQIIIPVDEVEIDGIEVDATVQVTDGFSINLGVAVNDSEITKDSFRGLVGNETPQTPDHTINLGIQYVDPGNRFFVRADWQQIGELFFMPANWVARDELDLLNLRAGINFGDDESMQLTVWCENCTDENYFAEGFNDNGGLFFYGKLRRAGVEFTKRW